ATGLPILLSTGASTEEEIVDTVQRLQHSTARDRLVLLHCISCYPTPIERINLRAISTLAERFGVPVGLSDHTLSTHTGGWAVAAGACLLEKHFTLDPNRKGPDHAMSLPPDRMAEYIARARQAQRALGTGTLGMKPEEKEVRYAARRSIVAAADIPAGAVLTQSMLALKRPGTGLPPTALDHLTGRQTTVSIPRDTILTWDMVR
ncbi:MAG: N-acetylneuraminate synthase, partial [Planctomycetota bacterium]